MPPIPALAEDVRRLDRDRFLCTLFAPAEIRDTLFALYAFNLEVAKTREVVSEHMLGLMRLAWWREAVEDMFEGRLRRHAVLEALAPAAEEGTLSRELMVRLVDVREADISGQAPLDLNTLEHYAEHSAGVLLEQALVLSGVKGEEERRMARHIGTAYAVVGILRSARIHFMQGHVLFPHDLMQRHGVSLDHFGAPEFLERARKVAEPMTALAREHLHRARKLRKVSGGDRRRMLHVLLMGTVAETYLRRIEKAGYDVFATDLEQGRFGLQMRLLREAWFG